MTARLIAKHFGVLEARVAAALALVEPDPAAASAAQHAHLAATIAATAQVLATARAAFDQEHAHVAQLRTLIANDEMATGKLARRLAAGTISETTVMLFCDELEANKARLPQALPEEADARAYLDDLQAIVDQLGAALAGGGQLAGLRGQCAALRALTRRAQPAAPPGAGPAAVRQAVSAFQCAGESALERLQRLSARGA